MSRDPHLHVREVGERARRPVDEEGVRPFRDLGASVQEGSYRPGGSLFAIGFGNEDGLLRKRAAFRFQVTGGDDHGNMRPAAADEEASSRPFMGPGIFTSVKSTRTSVRFRRTSCAAWALAVSITSKPASSRASAVASRMKGSSSTSSTTGREGIMAVHRTGALAAGVRLGRPNEANHAH